MRGAMTVAAAVLVLAGGLQAAPVRAAGTEQDTGNTGRTADDGARGKDFWEDDELPAATIDAVHRSDESGTTGPSPPESPSPSTS